MARRLFSKPILAKGERNSPPSADQGLSIARPRSSPCYLDPVLEPTHFPLSAGAESPKDIARSDITSLKLYNTYMHLSCIIG